MKTDQTSFNLVGDGDDVDVLEEIERLFGIEIEDSEAETLETFQQLVDLVESKTDLVAANNCLLAHAFRQIRDSGAIKRQLCRPSQRLEAILGSGDLQKEIKKLSDVSHLDLTVGFEHSPMMGVSSWNWFGVVIVIGFTFALVMGNAWPLLGLVVLASLAFFFWPQRLPLHIVSLGDLIRQSLPNNYNRLQSRYGSGNAADRKVVIEAVCREMACYSGPVNAETTFISNRRLI